MTEQVAEDQSTLHAQPNTPVSPGAKFDPKSSIHTGSMDGRQPAYQQPGLTSPYPQSLQEHDSETSSADQGSAPSAAAAAAAVAAAAHYAPGQDGRPSNFSSAATPTSEYGLNPPSARSASFTEYGGGAAAAAAAQQQQQQRYHSAAAGQSGGVGGGMAAQQPPPPTSPSMPLMPHGQAGSNGIDSIKSDTDLPIDPSIAAQTSPTYPNPTGQYSPYTPQHEMSHFPPHSGTPGIYQRPEWAGSYPPHQPPPQHLYGHPSATTGPPTPTMVSPVARPPGVRNTFMSLFGYMRALSVDIFQL